MRDYSSVPKPTSIDADKLPAVGKQSGGVKVESRLEGRVDFVPNVADIFTIEESEGSWPSDTSTVGMGMHHYPGRRTQGSAFGLGATTLIRPVAQARPI